ncbi:Cna B-type domain-containing protein [Alloscardovia macacae]|uniref:Cna B-type domain-containing protein n=1 Tax=Alloscardovia macacae TaxID=1160091 RepID=UPI001314BB14|nr:Cna B-type domain-containing protein [Alloscardovia macacae]
MLCFIFSSGAISAVGGTTRAYADDAVANTTHTVNFWRNRNTADEYKVTCVIQSGQFIPGVGQGTDVATYAPLGKDDAGKDTYCVQPNVWGPNFGRKDALEIFGMVLGGSRFSAWNTARDGSGTYYRGQQVLTDSDSAEIDLYEQWASAQSLLDGAKDFATQKPQVWIENSLDHQTDATALNVWQAGSLHYRATLDFSQNRNTLSTLWGRIDRVTDYKGFIKAKIDSKYTFDKPLDIVFASTWLVPNQEEMQKAVYSGVTVTQVDVTNTLDGKPEKAWKFTYPASYVGQETQTINVNGTDRTFNVINIPVTMISKAEMYKLSFDDFMRPMELSVADDYARGLNAVISEEQYNAIAVSDDPYLRVGGEIDMEINGNSVRNDPNDTTNAYTHYSNQNPQANWQVARLFPSSQLDVALYDIQTGEKLTAASPITNTVTNAAPQGDSALYGPKGAAMSQNAGGGYSVAGDQSASTFWRSRGRSKQPVYTSADPNDPFNTADTWKVTPPDIPGYMYVKAMLPSTQPTSTTGVSESFVPCPTSGAGCRDASEADLEGSYDFRTPQERTLFYARLGSIGTKVWIDANRDGVYQDGETVVPDTKVELLYPDGTPALNTSGQPITATTDAQGNYELTNIIPNEFAGAGHETYMVRFTLPSGYSVTRIGDATTGINSTSDRQGYVRDVVVGPGQHNPTVNLGMYASTSITVTKKWDDRANVASERPESIHVKLMNAADVDAETHTAKDGAQPVAEADMSAAADGTWSHTFTDIPTHDASGAQLSYTVLEDPVAGYEAGAYSGDAASGFTITNAKRFIDIPVRKVWLDAQGAVDTSNTNPVTVELWKNGVATGRTVELNASNNFTGRFTNVAVDPGSNADEVYSVRESGANGSLISVNGALYMVDDNDGKVTDAAGVTITNMRLTTDNPVTPDPDRPVAERLNIPVQKVWDDRDNVAAGRPASVTVHLLANGTEVASTELNAAGSWKHVFENQPVVDASGARITYSVTEDAVAGYESPSYTGNERDGFTVTNAKRFLDIPVRKVWLDAQGAVDASNTNPVTVELMKKDTATGVTVATGQTLVLNPANNFTGRFTNVPVDPGTDADKVYTVQEVGVTDSVISVDGKQYASDVQGSAMAADGFTVRNMQLAPNTPVTPDPDQPVAERLNIPVQKVWDDRNNADKARPESITVHLYANGTEVASAQLNEAGEWRNIFQNQPVVDARGERIRYAVVEDAVEGYNAPEYAGNERDGFTVTNTKPAGTVTVPGEPGDPENPRDTPKDKPGEPGTTVPVTKTPSSPSSRAARGKQNLAKTGAEVSVAVTGMALCAVLGAGAVLLRKRGTASRA